MNIDRGTCPGDQHGTSNAYRNHGCRCTDAKVANTRYVKHRLAGLHEAAWVSAVGVVRRRQALAVMGYSLIDLAPHLGVSWRAVSNYQRRPRVHRSTFQRWCQVYDELSMTPGPSKKAREEALRRGWASPLAWDEGTIDDSAAVPDRGSRATRRTADVAGEARHLIGFGTSICEIARRLDVSESWIRQLLGGGKRAAA